MVAPANRSTTKSARREPTPPNALALPGARQRTYGPASFDISGLSERAANGHANPRPREVGAIVIKSVGRKVLTILT